MQQRRLNAYLNLIQELLTCPKGEEWIRLKQHEHLVDSELLQVMEQVASQLLREGNRQAAIFLHNWAAKLHHILVKETPIPKPEDDKFQAYLALIQDLLSSSEDDKERLLAKHHDLIGPGLVHQMQQVAQQLKQQGSDESADYLQHLADELNQAWIAAHAFQPELQKESSHVPLKTADSATENTDQSSKVAGAKDVANEDEGGSPSQQIVSTQPLTTSLQLKVNQQLTDAISEISQALHQLNQTIMAQSHRTNPLWYMDVLERAATAQWLLTTDEIEQLMGVKPKCHGKDKIYQRGTWTFVKVGKLGAQTAWKVTKTRLDAAPPSPIINNPDTSQQPSHRQTHEIKPSLSLAKHPPLKQTALNNGSSDSDQTDLLEIPEMDDVWA
ncbi:hypothetical protein [Adonisia turfae]|uniref:Uncharacterized protein n=1 Tax=Adonisia turfae CCMR0081 TaxID=2292702 RepID=A0A6M0RLJ9_9CYAN|nr:hypothetical protein [Adonisia turfae]NEZ57128.1 hypothetical protein [Adonisia turfae CCMR0081]